MSQDFNINTWLGYFAFCKLRAQIKKKDRKSLTVQVA